LKLDYRVFLWTAATRIPKTFATNRIFQGIVPTLAVRKRIFIAVSRRMCAVAQKVQFHHQLPDTGNYGLMQLEQQLLQALVSAK
jgi:hypothetical protein